MTGIIVVLVVLFLILGYLGVMRLIDAALSRLTPEELGRLLREMDDGR